MEKDPGQRISLHWRGAQKSHRRLSRQLAVDLWRIRTGRCTAEELGLIV
jgi:hypothetical protein